jgi:hypothetical protein
VIVKHRAVAHHASKKLTDEHTALEQGIIRPLKNEEEQLIG